MRGKNVKRGTRQVRPGQHAYISEIVSVQRAFSTRRLFAKLQGGGESSASQVEEGMLNQARAFPILHLRLLIFLAIASTPPDLLQLFVPIQHVLMSRLAVPIRALGTVSRF